MHHVSKFLGKASTKIETYWFRNTKIGACRFLTPVLIFVTAWVIKREIKWYVFYQNTCWSFSPWSSFFHDTLLHFLTFSQHIAIRHNFSGGDRVNLWGKPLIITSSKYSLKILLANATIFCYKVATVLVILKFISATVSCRWLANNGEKYFWKWIVEWLA